MAHPALILLPEIMQDAQPHRTVLVLRVRARDDLSGAQVAANKSQAAGCTSTSPRPHSLGLRLIEFTSASPTDTLPAILH
jgi:hypothetical protein